MISSGVCLYAFAFHPRHFSLAPSEVEGAKKGVDALRCLWETATAGWGPDSRFRVDKTFPINDDKRLHVDGRTSLLATACCHADLGYPRALLAEAGDALVLTLCISDNKAGGEEKWKEAWSQTHDCMNQWRDAWQSCKAPGDPNTDSPEAALIGFALVLFAELSQEEQSPGSTENLDRTALLLAGYRGDFLSEPFSRDERHGGQSDHLRYRRLKPARGLQDTLAVVRLHAKRSAPVTVEGRPVSDANPRDADKPLDGGSVFLPLVLLVSEYPSRLPPFVQYLLDNAKIHWYERETQSAKRKIADGFRQFEELQRKLEHYNHQNKIKRLLLANIKACQDDKEKAKYTKRLEEIEAIINSRSDHEIDELLENCMISHSRIREHLIDLVHYEASLKISLQNLALFYSSPTGRVEEPNLFDQDHDRSKKAASHAENVLRQGEKLVEQAEGILDDHNARVAQQRLKAEEQTSKSLENLQIFIAGFTVFELVRNGYQMSAWSPALTCFVAAIGFTWFTKLYVKQIHISEWKKTFWGVENYFPFLLLVLTGLIALAAQWVWPAADKKDQPPAVEVKMNVDAKNP